MGDQLTIFSQKIIILFAISLIVEVAAMAGPPQDVPSDRKAVPENSGTTNPALQELAGKVLSDPEEAKNGTTARKTSPGSKGEGKSDSSQKGTSVVECESVESYEKQIKALKAIHEATKLIAKERTSLGIQPQEHTNPITSQVDRAKDYPKQETILKAIDDLVQTKSPDMTRREAYWRAAQMISKDLAADGLKLDANDYYRHAEEKSDHATKDKGATTEDIVKAATNIARSSPQSLPLRIYKELSKLNSQQQAHTPERGVDPYDREIIGIQFDIIDKKEHKSGTLGVLFIPSHERMRPI